MSGLLPTFTRRRIQVGEIAVNVVGGGDGPPLVLLHGYPQTHVAWHEVAPRLAERFTVVCPDLRGYGDSDKPPGDPDHRRYAKRAMAGDISGLMAALGHDRFAVVGHDRGALVGHRLALDHPDAVTHLAVLDVLPQLDMWEAMDRAFGLAGYHLFFLAQPADFPERLIGADPDMFLTHTLRSWCGTPDAITDQALAAYRAAFADPRTIHATCEDYRAGATVDVDHDAEDRDRAGGSGHPCCCSGASRPGSSCRSTRWPCGGAGPGRSTGRPLRAATSSPRSAPTRWPTRWRGSCPPPRRLGRLGRYPRWSAAPAASGPR